jgi:2-polyprenyl-6-methoxyphenol hydroxylase-like FAD-dependent oxidoreductase
MTHTQPTLDDSYEVIVIGGGPAGAAAGALLAEYGHRTLVLERTKFPRFHVGESLIPETYWSLKRLGLLDQLKASAYPKIGRAHV